MHNHSQLSEFELSEFEVSEFAFIFVHILNLAMHNNYTYDFSFFHSVIATILYLMRI